MQEPNEHRGQEEKGFNQVFTRYPDYKEVILFAWNKAKKKLGQLLLKQKTNDKGAL